MGLAVAAVAFGAGAQSVSASETLESVVDVVREALNGWAQFASTGDVAAANGAFVVDGPQWRQFEAESAAWEQLHGGDPLRLQIRQFRLRYLDSTTATVWAEVEATRAGFISGVFGWDFDLLLDNGRWRVWTVVPADPPSELAQVAADPDPPEPLPTTATAPRTSDTVPQSTAAGGALTASAADRSRGTRIPVLSAWIVVVTVVGVAIAGYLAPRIDRREEG